MQFRSWAVAFTVAAVTLLSACSKKNEGDGDDNPCNIYGGVISPNTYLFWMAQDFGQLTVEVKDKYGVVQSSYYKNVKVYYPNGEPVSCNVELERNAVFTLSPGQTYTYRAYNSNRSFIGNISISCEQGKCFKIQIK